MRNSLIKTEFRMTRSWYKALIHVKEPKSVLETVVELAKGSSGAEWQNLGVWLSFEIIVFKFQEHSKPWFWKTNNLLFQNHGFRNSIPNTPWGLFWDFSMLCICIFSPHSQVYKMLGKQINKLQHALNSSCACSLSLFGCKNHTGQENRRSWFIPVQ